MRPSPCGNQLYVQSLSALELCIVDYLEDTNVSEDCCHCTIAFHGEKWMFFQNLERVMSFRGLPHLPEPGAGSEKRGRLRALPARLRRVREVVRNEGEFHK